MAEERKLKLPVKMIDGRMLLAISKEEQSQYNLTEIRMNMLGQGVGNMRLDNIKKVIEKASGKAQDIGPVFTFFDTSKEKHIDVMVSDDSLRAIIEVRQWDNPKITVDDLRFCLYKAGVIEGIDEDALKEAAREMRADREIKAAKSIPAIDGEPAEIEHVVRVSSKPQPRILKDGSVDLKSYDMLVPVEENQVLLRKKPPTEGIPGLNVRGQPLPANPGKDIQLPKGAKGTYLTDNGRELRTSVAGCVMKAPGGGLYVEQTYEVRRDVDYSTGNIDFSGNVIVKGDVLSGFSLKTTGDVVIHGVVEGATVISTEGSVTIKGGVHGRQNAGYIEAKHTVAAKFIQEATAVAGDTVMVSAHILDSTIKAKKKVDASAKEGSIINSIIYAGEEIIAQNMGGPNARGTEAAIRDFDLSTAEIKEKLTQLEQEMIKACGGEEELINIMNRLSEASVPKSQIEFTVKNYYKKMETFQEGLLSIHSQYCELKNVARGLLRGRIIIIGTLHPGVKLSIAGRSWTETNGLKQVKFFVEKGKIAYGPYTPE